ncbi:hypothetical protein [Streptomyces sp. NPDC008001]
MKLDAGAERARKALEKKFERKRMTTKPRSSTAKTAAAKTVA